MPMQDGGSQHNENPRLEAMMARIPLFPLSESMTPEQQRVYDKIISGPRGVLVGPLRAVLHSPELADRFQYLGAFLRYETSLPRRLKELAILVTARRWNSQIEWHVHAKAALKYGLSETVINAIKDGGLPEFSNPDEKAVYEFSRQIQELGHISKKTYSQIVERFDSVGVVELTTLIGYYTMVSMTLNAHEIPLPEGVETPLKPISREASDIPAEGNRYGLTKLVPINL